jgi:hypothetical protein
MKASVIAVLATIFGCLLTALGYILIKRSHVAGAKKGRHNFLTVEFAAGFFVCGTSTAISVGKKTTFSQTIFISIYYTRN